MTRTGLWALVLSASLASAAAAQCTRVDFENLAAGAAVTSQYDGVTFSTFPGSTMRILANIAGGTSSGTKCIRIDPDGGGASIDALRMVFDDLQSEVTFMLGTDAGNYSVSAYSTPAGAGIIGAPQVIVLGPPQAPGPGVHRFVRVSAPLGNLRRIEITGAQSTFEAIDDLAFNEDDTAPTAQINAPAYGACVCGNVPVTGLACDSDGVYGSDKLEYQRVDAAPGAAWTQVGTFTTPVCAAGALYTWNTAPAGITDGFYYLRLTVINECGLTSTDTTVVYVDKSFSLGAGSVRTPPEGSLVGGSVCIDGTVWDMCPGTFTVKYKPAIGGAYQPVDPLFPSYAAWISNDPFATWNTGAGGAAVVDGNYLIEVKGNDQCGNTATVVRSVAVDNTKPVAQITAPASCTRRCGVIAVTGTVNDAHLGGWVLEYTTQGAAGWTFLAQGAANVNNALLFNWNTAGLPRCAYTLRLRASDTAAVNCGSTSNQKEFLVSFDLGAYADCNGDGILTVADFGCFQGQFVLGCP
ncbi:MAG: hypothetical protein ACKVU4_03435 [Phycisphaerales bacterium]